MKRIIAVLFSVFLSLMIVSNVYAGGGPDTTTSSCNVYVRTSTSAQGEIHVDVEYSSNGTSFGFFNVGSPHARARGGGEFSNVRVSKSVNGNRAKVTVKYNFHYSHGRHIRGSRTCSYNA